MPARIVAHAALIALCGCSFAFVQGPPADTGQHVASRIECTDSFVLPVVDYAVYGATFVGAMLAMDRVLEPDTRAAPHFNTRGLKILGVAIVASTPWFLSGESGRRRVSACRRARAR